MPLSAGVRDVVYTAWGALAMGRRGPRRQIHIWPGVESQEEFNDLLPRLQFHFPRDCNFHITLRGHGIELPTERPYHMGDYSARADGNFILAEESAPRPLWPLIVPPHHVLLNRPVATVPGGRRIQYLPNVAPFDPREVEMETFWAAKFHHAQNRRAVAPSRERFLRYIQKLPKREKAYLLCTGPSLSRFREFDFSDGHVIACNSVVSNRALLEHSRPDFVVASDPIFHFGPSIYAEQFRQDLASAARDFPFLFMTLDVYAHLLRAHVDMPEERWAVVPNCAGSAVHDLRRDWFVPRTANIMTMFMLGVAATLAKEIYIIGADGREPGETYFWKHDPASQLTDKMQAIKDCHPAFFERRNYADYYDRHCEVVDHQVRQIESAGGRVYTLTPSFIPALARRPAP